MVKKPSYEELKKRLKKSEEGLKLAQKALRDGEEIYRLHFENASDVIFSIDPELKIISVSPSVERIIGYKPEELGGKSFLDLGLLAEAYLKVATSDATRALSGERIPSSVYEFIAKDGSRRFGELSAAPLVRDGKVVGLACIARDITDRRQAEQALLEREEMYRSLFENTGTAMGIVDEDMTISMANNELAKLSGYSNEEIEGKIKTTKLVAEEDLERMKGYHFARRENEAEAPREYEFRLVDKQGNIKDVSIKTAMIPGTKRSVSSLVDITSHKEAEAALGSSGITVNKNAVPFDKRGPFITSGVRIGTPYITSRGMKADEMKQIGAMIINVLKNPEDQNILTRTKDHVAELCKAFPLY